MTWVYTPQEEKQLAKDAIEKAQEEGELKGEPLSAEDCDRIWKAIVESSRG